MADHYPDVNALWEFGDTDPELLSQAPWFSVHGLQDGDTVERYADLAGSLPGGLHLDVVRSWDWTTRVVVYNALLRPSAIPRRIGAGTVVFVKQRIRRTPSAVKMPSELRMDTWAYRTQGEVSYVGNLAYLDDNPTWGFDSAPSLEMVAWDRPLLPAWFPGTDEAPEFWEKLRFERNARNRLGYLVAYPWVEVNDLKLTALAGRYPALPAWWPEWEVRIGFRAELPPSIFYLGQELIRSPVHSHLWAVVRTEWVLIVGKRFLWAASGGELFLLPDRVLGSLMELDLSGLYGSPDVYAAMLACLRAHQQVNWQIVPPGEYPDGRGRQPAGMHNHSPGGGFDAGLPGGGYFVQFDWDTKMVTDAQYLFPPGQEDA